MDIKRQYGDLAALIVQVFVRDNYEIQELLKPDKLNKICMNIVSGLRDNLSLKLYEEIEKVIKEQPQMANGHSIAHICFHIQSNLQLRAFIGLIQSQESLEKTISEAAIQLPRGPQDGMYD